MNEEDDSYKKMRQLTNLAHYLELNKVGEWCNPPLGIIEDEICDLQRYHVEEYGKKFDTTNMVDEISQAREHYWYEITNGYNSLQRRDRRDLSSTIYPEDYGDYVYIFEDNEPLSVIEIRLETLTKLVKSYPHLPYFVIDDDVGAAISILIKKIHQFKSKDLINFDQNCP